MYIALLYLGYSSYFDTLASIGVEPVTKYNDIEPLPVFDV